MRGDVCTDNRFEMIEKYKQKLIEATNIETSANEMAVLDSILFRFWQMGWLDKLDGSEIITCNQCVHYQQNHHYCEFLDTEFSPSDYCSFAERREDES